MALCCGFKFHSGVMTGQVAVDVPDVPYVVAPDNTFGEGFSFGYLKGENELHNTDYKNHEYLVCSYLLHLFCTHSWGCLCYDVEQHPIYQCGDEQITSPEAPAPWD